jgi:hypothetical protein
VARLKTPHLKDLHSGAEVPDDIAGWLRELVALTGVPFSYLLPDATLLPPESIRFFAVDLNWIRALVQGAGSIGRASSFDAAHEAALAPALHAAARLPERATGFLLRSAVVDAWPGLEVTAYDGVDPTTRDQIGAAPVSSALASPLAAGAGTLVVETGDGERFPDPPFEIAIASTNEIVRCTAVNGDRMSITRGSAPVAAAKGSVVTLRHPRLRLERLGPSLLLFITAGTLAEVHIHEPAEGLHFGLDAGGASKALRYTTQQGTHQAGDPVGKARAPLPVTYRPGDEHRAVDIATLAGGMASEPFAKNAAGHFTSAEFALQLIEGVESVVFGLKKGTA